MVSKYIKKCAREVSERLSRFPLMQTYLKQRYRDLPRYLRGPQLVHDQLSRLTTRHSSPFFIQIGANDGITNDHLYPFVKRYGWKGILLEPVPLYYERLCEVYRGRGLILENAAIGERDGLKEFYYFEDNKAIPKWASGCGSFIPENLIAQTRELPDLINYLRKTEVPCLTFTTLMEKHERSSVDLIMIDAEGYDWEVLQQVKIDEWNVSTIIFEHCILPQDILDAAREYLERFGFELTNDSYDTVATRQIT